MGRISYWVVISGSYKQNLNERFFTSHLKNVADIEADTINSSKLLENHQSNSYLVSDIELNYEAWAHNEYIV